MVDLAGSGQVDQFGARRFVELLARALQSCMLLRHGDDAVTKAYIQTRLSNDTFGCFGTLPSGLDIDAIMARAAVQAVSGAHG